MDGVPDPLRLKKKILRHLIPSTGAVATLRAADAVLAYAMESAMECLGPCCCEQQQNEKHGMEHVFGKYYLHKKQQVYYKDCIGWEEEATPLVQVTATSTAMLEDLPSLRALFWPAQVEPRNAGGGLQLLSVRPLLGASADEAARNMLVPEHSLVDLLHDPFGVLRMADHCNSEQQRATALVCGATITTTIEGDDGDNGDLAMATTWPLSSCCWRGLLLCSCAVDGFYGLRVSLLQQQHQGGGGGENNYLSVPLRDVATAAAASRHVRLVLSTPSAAATPDTTAGNGGAVRVVRRPVCYDLCGTKEFVDRIRSGDDADKPPREAVNWPAVLRVLTEWVLDGFMTIG